MEKFDYCIYVKVLKSFYAKLTLYKNWKGKFRKMFSCDPVIGENGGEKSIEGDKKTPYGTWKIGSAYGTSNNPNICIPYIKINKDMYWCSTSTKGKKYNTLIYKSCNPYENYTLDEHLIDYPTQYKYFLDIGFNKERIPYAGSAIFLHCWSGPNIPTSGCIGIAEESLLKILQTINKNTSVTIY